MGAEVHDQCGASGNEWRVRPATGGDAAALAAFNRAMARETEARELDAEVVAAGVRTALDDPAHGFYLVAETDGRVVGALLVTREWSDWRNAAFWWVQSVYVVPEARGRGIYRGLYDAVRSRAADDGGVCGVRLYVERDNLAAQQVYQRLGMQPTAYLMYEEIFAR